MKRWSSRKASAPTFVKYSSGEMTLPLDFDIARPPRRIIPWQNSWAKGSRTSFGPSPVSPSALV